MEVSLFGVGTARSVSKGMRGRWSNNASNKYTFPPPLRRALPAPAPNLIRSVQNPTCSVPALWGLRGSMVIRLRPCTLSFTPAPSSRAHTVPTHLGTGAHSNANIGGSEGGGVVDSVPYHGDTTTAHLEFLNLSDGVFLEEGGIGGDIIILPSTTANNIPHSFRDIFRGGGNKAGASLKPSPLVRHRDTAAARPEVLSLSDSMF